jgi:hypothetical protein
MEEPIVVTLAALPLPPSSDFFHKRRLRQMSLSTFAWEEKQLVSLAAETKLPKTREPETKAENPEK